MKETVQALAALPVPYSAPLARQTVSLPEGTVQNTQASLSDVSVPVEMINAQEVVQIGAPHNTDTQDGFFGRIFKKIASIFGR